MIVIFEMGVDIRKDLFKFEIGIGLEDRPALLSVAARG